MIGGAEYKCIEMSPLSPLSSSVPHSQMKLCLEDDFNLSTIQVTNTWNYKINY